MTDKKECRNHCKKKPLFPIRLYNRPGLPHIDYRIGSYRDFREALLRGLDKDPTLGQWTHREPDDPGIALLEGASILGDILTFYQQLYANEAFLRTAQWRESIADIVRLTGYRLAPGIGGRTVFAFEVKGEKPVTIPASLPIRAQVTSLDQDADFETTKEITAHPALNRFNLYRPRSQRNDITAGMNCLEILKVDGNDDYDSKYSIDIQSGDRIILVPDTTQTEEKAEILIVSEVRKILDRVEIYFEGPLTSDHGQQVTAYRIGRTFSHFGYNAAPVFLKFDEGQSSYSEVPINFDRVIFKTNGSRPSAKAQWGSLSSLKNRFQQKYVKGDLLEILPNTTTSKAEASDEDGIQDKEVTFAEFAPEIKKNEIPLSHEVDDLAMGGSLICHGITKEETPFTTIIGIQDLYPASIKFGNVQGPMTVVVFEVKESVPEKTVDIRNMRFHEMTSPAIELRAPTEWVKDAFPNGTLNYFGTHEQATLLKGRQVLMERNDGQTFWATVTETSANSSQVAGEESKLRMWTVVLDKKPDVFKAEDFDEEHPTITVYGNLAEADQGKTEKEAVLGNGDNREKFQTFKLPKAPLTYHLHSDQNPPQVPELELYVNDRLWRQVPVFLGHGPKEEIYIVREDDDNISWVQFGDGKTGARLPSGKGNVKAVYRTGTGAYGPLKEETNPQTTGKVDRLDKIVMPGSAAGGDEPETGEKTREVAPGKTLSLGRLVSLKDYESEALAIPGVSKVSVVWEVTTERSLISLTILMETGRAAEYSEVENMLNNYNTHRGPQRFPVEIFPGQRSYIYLHAEVSIDATHKEASVKDQIKKALGVTGADGREVGDGLFSLKNQRFGQTVYISQIEATIQNVEGVIWVKLKELVDPGHPEEELDNPDTLDTTTFTASRPKDLSTDSRHIFCLYENQLELSISKNKIPRRQ
jgi:hypothetical protein